MQTATDTRQHDVEALIAQTRLLLDTGELDRSQLGSIQLRLQALAAKAEYWTADDYADPEASEQQNRFRVGGEGEGGITLYLNVMRPGKKILPHDHTTWACIAAVSGVELNGLYDRLDNGSTAGRADIRERELVELKPGNSLALMPDDIHSVEIPGEDIIRHLHLYGQPLESLVGRKMFDIKAGTYRVMDIGVKTKT